MTDRYQLPPELSDDERTRLLANPHRRTVIAVVTAYSEATTTTSLGELASDVDRRVRSREGTDGTATERLLFRLHHVHLPMLDEAGVIDYDPETKRVALHGPDVETPLAAREPSYSD